MCAAVNVNASAGWVPGQKQDSVDPLAGTMFAGLFASYDIDYSYLPPNAGLLQIDIPALNSLPSVAAGAVSEASGLINDLFNIGALGGYSKTFEQKLNESCIEMTQEQAICSFYEFQHYLQDDGGLGQAEKDKIEQVQKQMDSALCAYENCLCAMKPLPDDIKACVDVQAAAAGLAELAGQCIPTFQSKTSADMKIVEVPITFEDFEQEPDKYPDLQKMQVALDDMAMPRQWFIDNFEWYAEQFGYTKKEYQYKTDFSQIYKNLIPKIEENSIVQDFAENSINIILRSGFQALQTPLKFIASLAGPEFGPIGTLPAKITQIIDSVCELCTVDISEEDINQRVVEINAALEESTAQNELAASIPQLDPNDSVQKQAEDLRVQAKLKYDFEKKKADELAAGALDGIKCPDMDIDMLTWFIDLWMAVMQFISQITNIFLVIIFSIIGNILKTIAQILKSIGLTAIAPVENFAKLLSNAKTILTFIIGLPQSLITMIKAIYLKKMKMIYIIRHPIPKKPLVSKKPVLACSDDVDSLENLGDVKPYVENARKFKKMTDARKK